MTGKFHVEVNNRLFWLVPSYKICNDDFFLCPVVLLLGEIFFIVAQYLINSLPVSRHLLNFILCICKYETQTAFTQGKEARKMVVFSFGQCPRSLLFSPRSFIAWHFIILCAWLGVGRILPVLLVILQPIICPLKVSCYTEFCCYQRLVFYSRCTKTLEHTSSRT